HRAPPRAAAARSRAAAPRSRRPRRGRRQEFGCACAEYTRRMPPLTRRDFEDARARMGEHVYHTPIITSRLLSERTGYDVRLKAELFQRGGSYKIRGPMNKFALL